MKQPPCQFKIGDRVIRRPGTLGNMTGDQAPGCVLGVHTEPSQVAGHVHWMVKVQFVTPGGDTRTETMVEETYQKS